jgi:predicted RNA-binding Zn-ribbon protein involved in translation (DUF1610 family)
MPTDEADPQDRPEQKVKAKRFTCQACGGEMEFDATIRKLKCKFCGETRDVDGGDGAVEERDFFEGLASAPRGLGTEHAVKTAKCEECGASVAFPEGKTSAQCTFCGSKKVLEQAENTQHFRPESLLPFGIDKKQANTYFGRWLATLWFRPNDLKKLAQVVEITGVYVPFWTFDAHVDSQWTADAGYYYYVEESYTDSQGNQQTRQVRHTRWEPAWGSRHDFFDDVLVSASQGLPRDLADQFRTFNTKALVPYSPGYLAGWAAEEYAVDLEQGFGLGRDKMEKEQYQRCARDVPGDTHRNLQVNNTFSGITFKHVLLPVWISAYRYNNKVYRFLVNGQTGEVVGKAPYSWIKITLFTLFCIAVAVGIWFLIQKYGGHS